MRVVQRPHAEPVANERQPSRPGCHQAKANWPFRRSSAANPSRSSNRRTTSVSLAVENDRASAASSSGARGSCRPPRCRREGRCPGRSRGAATRPAGRRSPTGSRRGRPRHPVASPKPSGPRCRIARAIRNRASSSTGGPPCGRTIPAIPHTSVGRLDEDRGRVEIFGRDPLAIDLAGRRPPPQPLRGRPGGPGRPRDPFRDPT